MVKLCPLMSRPVMQSEDNQNSDILTTRFEEVSCRESKCALWVSTYTTELNSIQCCAFEAMALKNSDGLYRV